MPKGKVDKKTGKMKAVRSHKQKRAIQDSDAFLTALREAMEQQEQEEKNREKED